MKRLFELERKYIKENWEANKRKKDLERVWKTEQIENDNNDNTSHDENNTESSISKTASINTVNDEVYKKENPSEENLRKVETLQEKPDFSLESRLKEAEIDISRMVDSKNALSAAILQEFLPATKIKGKEDWIPESTYYKYYENSDFPFKVEKEYEFRFPNHLNVYSFERSNQTEFEPPKRGKTGVYNYYLMDGGSLLPVLALDLKPGCRMLDLCASPGGKSLVALQTLYPGCVVANDISLSRVNRIYKVFKQYFYDLNERFLNTGKIRVTNEDGRNFIDQGFDRILVSSFTCSTLFILTLVIIGVLPYGNFL